MRMQPFHESPGLAAYRFVLEVAAWIFIYFAWGWIPGILSVAALSLFSVEGDKHLVLVSIGGPLRIALEAVVLIGGATAAGRVFGPAGAAAFGGALLLLAGLGHRRWVWLWHRRRPA